MDKSKRHTIDTKVPNMGRIYNYLLGRGFNFEADRIVGDQLKKTVPGLSNKGLRLIRSGLQNVAHSLSIERGFDTIIDFASGLPTVEHIHSTVAPSTTVIYSDIDFLTVEYGLDILRDTSNAHYFQSDCTKPEELLNHPEVQEILGNNRRIAFVFWGISIFMTDEEIAHAAGILYEWSNNESCLVFHINILNENDPALAQGMDLYNKIGDNMHLRSLELFQELVKPWHADELGYRLLEELQDVKVNWTEDDRKAMGPTGGAYCVYLVK